MSKAVTAFPAVQLRQREAATASTRYSLEKVAMRRSLRATRSGTDGPGRVIGHPFSVAERACTALTVGVGIVLNREDMR